MCRPYKAYAAELMADFLREHQNKRGIVWERLSEYGLSWGVVAMQWCWHFPARESVYVM